jgi:hypothetical protein
MAIAKGGTCAEETFDYQGYRLDLFRDGLGWHVFIYAPGSAVPLCDVPVQPRDDSRDLVIKEAKRLCVAIVRGVFDILLWQRSESEGAISQVSAIVWGIRPCLSRLSIVGSISTCRSTGRGGGFVSTLPAIIRRCLRYLRLAGATGATRSSARRGPSSTGASPYFHQGHLSPRHRCHAPAGAGEIYSASGAGGADPRRANYSPKSSTW